MRRGNLMMLAVNVLGCTVSDTLARDFKRKSKI